MPTKPAEVEIDTPQAPAIVRPNDPGTFIAIALEKGLDGDALTKLYDLYERHEKNQAVKAYNEAMQQAQAEMPTIVCDCTNPQTRSKYPSVENINRRCKPVYTRHGFALSFGEGKADVEGMIRTTCTVLHRGGHSQEFFIDLPSDGVGIKGNQNMTAIHGRLSSKTYAQSKQLREIFNLTVADVGDDNDGNGAQVTIGQEMIDRLEYLLKATGADRDKFLAWAEIKDLGDMLAKDFPKARAALERKQKEQEVAGL